MNIRMTRAMLGLVLLAVVLVAVGCGGGGSSTAPPVDATLFVPNYVTSLSGLYHWPDLPMTISFDLPDNWAELYGADQNLHIQAATQWNQPGKQVLVEIVPWGSPSNTKVQFVSYTELGGGDIRGLTETTHYTSGQMVTARIRVALDTRFTALASADEARVTIAHEIGHALGVIGHSPDPTDLMYPSHEYGEALLPTIQDVNTVMSAYPAYFGRAGMTRQPAAPLSGVIVTETIE